MRVGRLAAVAVFGLAITAGGATPLRAARTAGVVVLQAGRASGSLRPGDRLLAWDNDGVSGFLDDACAWLWVEAERGPRGPLRVTAQRSGRELRATLAQDDSSVLAGPPLPAGLHERVLRSLEEPPPKAGVAGLAGAVGDAAGPPGELWLRLMLARRWLDRGEPAAAVQLLDGAATDSAGTPHATLLLLELRARALLRAGRIAEASTAVDRALELVRTLDDAALFSARLHLVRGLMLKAAGSLHQAEAELQRARRVAGRLASGSLLEAEVLDRLGKVRFELGGRRAGLDLVRRGMAIFERAAPGSVALAESLNNLGGLEVEAGQLDAGRQHLERSRAIRERLPGQPGLYKVLYNLAGIAYLERRLEDAGALLDRAGAILERREPESAHMAQLLDVRMIVAEQRGALAEAERYGLRALELHHKLDPSSLETVACLINLGTVARSQEDLELAEKRYREALAIARRVAPDGVEVPHVLGDLAELALERGRHAEALTISREALKRLEALGAAPSTLAQVHQNLAAALLGVGQLDEAERECRTALALRRRQLPGSRDEAESLVGLGDIEDVRGRREAAARNFR
ncbi:MAG TPA: tetratricopeptide repeat protein, partial [Acidobacteria bacterium]|nr:tetratricopeptide repeat protein [Acidobacteriota bacterium]